MGMALSPYCHFERKREIFFVRGQAKDVRIAASGKHRAPSESEGRCFMQTALRKKTETGNEKDPSAALGMTKRGNASFHSFSTCSGSQPRLAVLGSPFQGKGLAWTLPPSYGRRCPEGAEVGWRWRYEKERGNASQVDDIREYPIHRWRGPPSPMGKATIREYRYPSIIRANTRICGENNIDEQSLPRVGKAKRRRLRRIFRKDIIRIRFFLCVRK